LHKDPVTYTYEVAVNRYCKHPKKLTPTRWIAKR